MTTKQLMSQIQEADPTGKRTVRLFNQSAGQEFDICFIDTEQQPYVHIELQGFEDAREWDENDKLIEGT